MNPIGAYAVVNGLISFCNKHREKNIDEVTIKVKLIVSIINDNNNDKVNKNNHNSNIVPQRVLMSECSCWGPVNRGGDGGFFSAVHQL